MIKFIYDKKIEESIFNEYILTRKNPTVCQMIKDELNVPIDQSSEYISEQINFIKKQWNNVSNKFLTALGSFYEETLPEPNLICYLTRLDIFPYKYNKDEKGNTDWFSAPMFGNPAERNRVIMHELCHYFQPNELPRLIKEAIPVILNDHDQFGMYSVDHGHPDENEQKWRKIIWDLYQKGKKFKELLKYYKQHID